MSNESEINDEPPPEKTVLEKMKDLLDVQGEDGNWNYDNYMRGMYNGMELMVSVTEDREPVYKELSDMPQPKEYPRLDVAKLELEGPITVKSSDNYLLIITDARGINHYWMPDGSYDGHCAPCEGGAAHADFPDTASTPA